MKPSFMDSAELKQMGFKSLGRNVQISRKASFYSPDTMRIGSHVRIDDFCILSGNIEIGNHVHIGAFSILAGAAGIVMEDYSGLSARVSIYTFSDDYIGRGMTNPTIPDKYRHVHKKPVRLGRHVIIGSGSVILPGVTIEEGAAVGALSLVAGSIR